MDFPRVTEVLKAFTNYDQVPQEILQRAAAKGTSVHAICAALAKEAWIPDSMISEELVGYIHSFKKWAEKQVEKFVVVEKRYSDEERKYTGQLDYVILGSDEQLYLVDLKTSAKPQKTYPVQMAAYNHLLNIHKIHVKGAMIVYLKKNGDFPDIHFIEDLSEESTIFFSALDCWHYFNKGKKNVRKRKRTKPDESNIELQSSN